MLYYLFQYLDHLNIPGAGVFQYISFRSGLAMLLSLLIPMLFGNRMIRYLQRKQIGESVRDLGLQGQVEKSGTPTMGGLLIIASVIIPAVLMARPDNIYIILLLLTTLWMGLIGFLDDYIKTFKKNKEGLAGKFKIFGQVVLGLVVGVTLFYHEDVVIRDYTLTEAGKVKSFEDIKSTVTTIPFVKDLELDYCDILLPFGIENACFIYIPVAILVITAVSNGTNMTDGIDGLASGTSAIAGGTLAVFAYVSGNMIFADYLQIMFIPGSGELVVFCSAFVGACIGFLWFNSYPAQIFMGDTGSLSIGGIIAVIALAIRKELLIPVLCGIFLVENLSVMVQVGYFKYTKGRTGEGVRLFHMAPLHHHFQKAGVHESKIVTRFFIVAIILAVLTLGTLKLR